MSRKLDLLIALAVLAGGVALALSGRLPAISRGHPTSPVSTPTAAGAPAAMPWAQLESLFGAAPAPRFRGMRRVEYLEMTGTPTGEHRYRVRQANGWRSVVQDSATREMPQPPGRPGMTNLTVQEMGGPLDLFRCTWQYVMTVGRGRASAETRVVALSGVQGRLFPLAVGNRLRFQALSAGQLAAGPMDRAQTETHVYEFHVTGVEGGYAGSTPAVPGPVYVIEVQVKDPRYGEDRVLEVHYAPALGAAVRVRDLSGPGTDERLVSWDPAP
jgi:hypothetical protein